MIQTCRGHTPNASRSVRDTQPTRRHAYAAAAVALLCCGLATAPVWSENAPEPPKKLCQPAADGQWNCSAATAPLPRQRNGAPVPPADTRVTAPASAPAARPVPVSVSNGSSVVPASTAGSNNSAEPHPKVRILTQPRTAWAIQLIATQSREALERIAEQQKLYDHPAVRLASDKVVRYALIWDVYPDRNSAQAAMNALPAALQALKPWLRPIGPLQDAMNEATRISPLPRK